MSLKNSTNDFFSLGLRMLAGLLIVLVLGFFITLVSGSAEAYKEFGLSFIWSNDWNPNYDDVGGTLGSLPFVVGTLLTSFLALLISIPFSLSIAIFLGEYFRKGPISTFFTSLVELLAGIPSVIYGFWALFYLVPKIQDLKNSLGLENNGFGVFTSAIVLSIMIIPFSASMTREVMGMVPQGLKESAYALGTTRFEVIKDIIFPYCKSGIFAGFILSLGRALGETMAVTMVIGNNNEIPKNLFALGNTMASLLANEFAEASEDTYISALIFIGLILFIVTTIINLMGKWVIKSLSRSA